MRRLQYKLSWMIIQGVGTRVNCTSYNRRLRAVKPVMRILLWSLSISPTLEAALDTQVQYCESISLPEVLNIRNVSEVYAKIIDQFRDNNTITLSLPENTEADLSALQLIEAARRQARAKGKTFTLSAPASGSLLKVLERAGFMEVFDQEDQKFWLHKEVTL